MLHVFESNFIKVVLLGSEPIFNIRLAVTAFKKHSIEYSGSIPVKTITGLFDVIDDPPIRNEFNVI